MGGGHEPEPCRTVSGVLVSPDDQAAGFRSEIAAAIAAGPDEFFVWFNDADDTDDSFRRGAWEFSTNIATPLARHLPADRTGTVVEVGYGGGRLLAAASRHFTSAVGVDVHEHADVVAGELERRGVKNCDLRQSDGITIPLADESVDAVYTFIVMQHVGRVAVFDGYVRETARVLRPGGAAVIYFGRWGRLSTRHQAQWLYAADRVAEPLILRAGYRERPSQINATNLLISLGHARRTAREAGLGVLDTLVSRRRNGAFGGQHGLIVRRI